MKTKGIEFNADDLVGTSSRRSGDTLSRSVFVEERSNFVQ